METTLEAVEAIREDQYVLEELLKNVVSDFETKHGVIVVGIKFLRYDVTQMGSQPQTLLSRVAALIAISHELADGRG